MPKRYTSREVLKALTKAGFLVISQRGSHVKLRGIKNGRIQTVIVPTHREVAVGTFGSILRQADISQAEFESYLK
jgi:predicted RNA binding protein YcfA (HicA-like mRNA interferase family)